jgi:HEAT repeat protein
MRNNWRSPLARRVRFGIIVIVLFALVAPRPVPAFTLPNHIEITLYALSQISGLSWGEQAELLKGAIWPDLRETDWPFTGSKYDERYHFDRNGDYAAVCRNFDYINRLIGSELAKTDRHPWAFGWILHAVEDFYSHSNYVLLLRDYFTGPNGMHEPDTTIEEVWLDPVRYARFIVVLRDRLMTGYYPNHRPISRQTDHGNAYLPWTPGMNKDSLVRDFNDLASHGAVSAARWYLGLYARDDQRIKEWKSIRGACSSLAGTSQDQHQLAASTETLIHKLYSSGDPDARRLSAYMLGQTEEPSSVPALADALFHDPSTTVREEAAHALGFVGNEAATDTLVTAVKMDQVASVKIMVLEALSLTKAAQHGEKSVISLISSHLDEPDPSIGASAARTLGDLRTPWVLEDLSNSLRKGQSAAVRRESAIAIGRLGNEAGISVLMDSALDRKEVVAVRTGAIEALSFYKSGPVEDAMLTLLADPVPEVRATAAYTSVLIRSYSSARRIPDLLKRSQDARVRTEAIAAMALWPERFEGPLRQVAASRENYKLDRLQALEGLQSISGKVARERQDDFVRRMLDASEPVAIQAAAVMILKRRKTPDNHTALAAFSSKSNLDPRVMRLLESGIETDSVKVPYLGGKSLGEAIDSLSVIGLHVGFERWIPSDSTKAGKVNLQIPPSFESAFVGDYVDLYMSSGPSPDHGKELPNLVSMNQRDAEAALEKIGLAPKFNAADGCARGDIVVYQVPEAASPGEPPKHLEAGEPVYLFLGDGSVKVVPDFSTVDLASIVKRKWPFFLFFVRSHNLSADTRGLAQSPPAGTTAFCGTWIYLSPPNSEPAS